MTILLSEKRQKLLCLTPTIQQVTQGISIVMDWFLSTWSGALQIVISAMIILVAVILLIRLNGLRSLSKMSSFDFSVTVAVGSILASTLLSDSVSVTDGVIGVGSLLLTQRLIALARSRIGASLLVDNSPVVLMVGDQMLDDTLKKVRVTHEDVRAKLREANVIELTEVHAVILESTGDISVLHSTGGKSLDPVLLKDVKGGTEALRMLDVAHKVQVDEAG